VRLALLAAALCAAALPTAAQDVARGRSLAAQACASCHGEDGRSHTPGVPTLAGQPAEFVTMQLILFREALRPVPAMQDVARGLGDADIEALAAFFAAQPSGPPEDRAARDAARFERGKALSARMNCGVCHLPDYAGRNQIPRLAGQREEYLAQALADFRDNRRAGSDTQMNGVMYGVTDSDIAALAHYLSHVE